MLKLIKLLFKILAIFLVAVAIISFGFIYFSTPQFPENMDSRLDSIMHAQLPELIQGKSAIVQANNTRIWYESISPKANTKTQGTILLFMGISNDAMGWPEKFIQQFVASGYRVIRFDYRGTGLSDWMLNWEENPYSLTDLAIDAEAILTHLQIQQVHLLGISMGGMVAQEFAIHYPKRSLTLTAIMSSGDIIDKELVGISKKTTFELIMIALKYGLFPSEKNTIKMHIAARIILRGDANYALDIEGIASQVLYNLRNRNGYNPSASAQHHQAVNLSGSRHQRLKKLSIPSLIIHGLQDPFIPIEHSQKLALSLPNASTLWIDNMGHDLPPRLFKSMLNSISQHMESHTRL